MPDEIWNQPVRSTPEVALSTLSKMSFCVLRGYSNIMRARTNANVNFYARISLHTKSCQRFCESFHILETVAIRNPTHGCKLL